ILGVDALGQADGEAEVVLLLGEYREGDRGPGEEWIFFDDRSGRSRIYAAMRWKSENLCLCDARLACGTSSTSVRQKGFRSAHLRSFARDSDLPTEFD